MSATAEFVPPALLDYGRRPETIVRLDEYQVRHELARAYEERDRIERLQHASTAPRHLAAGHHHLRCTPARHRPDKLRYWARTGYVAPASTTAGGHARWDLADLRRQLNTIKLQAHEAGRNS